MAKQTEPTKSETTKRLSPFSFYLTPPERAYLESRMDMERPAIGDALREMLISFQTLYGLPQRLADVIREEMAAKKMRDVAYIQDLLTERALELIRRKEQAEAAKPPSRGGKS